MKIPRKCYRHEAQLARDLKRRRDEEQIIAKLTPHMKLRVRADEELQQSNLGTVSTKNYLGT